MSCFDKPVTKPQGLVLLAAVVAILTLLFVPVYLEIRGLGDDMEVAKATLAAKRTCIAADSSSDCLQVGETIAMAHPIDVVVGSPRFQLITFGSISDREINDERLAEQCVMRAGATIVVREVDVRGFAKSEYDFDGQRREGDCPDGSAVLCDAALLLDKHLAGETPPARMQAMAESLRRFRSGSGGGT